MEPMLQPGEHRQTSSGGEGLLGAALDALPSHIAVLDEQASILLVYEAWRRFGSSNGNPDPTYGVGSSYLGVCEASAATCPDAARAARRPARRPHLADALEIGRQLHPDAAHCAEHPHRVHPPAARCALAADRRSS